MCTPLTHVYLCSVRLGLGLGIWFGIGISFGIVKKNRDRIRVGIRVTDSARVTVLGKVRDGVSIARRDWER